MAVIRFEPNIPVECALKYDGGKEVESRIQDAPNQMMYTLCGGDTIYVPLQVAGMIDKLGIKREELMSICKRVSGKVTRWEVKRISEAAEPEGPPNSFEGLPTALEKQLVRSIDVAKQTQRASFSPESIPAASPATASQQQSTNVTVLTTVGQTGLSMLLAGCMTAAIDAAVTARDYAHSKGLTISLSEESVQDLATSLLIHVQRMAELECKYDIKASAAANRMAQNGGVAWRR